MSVDHENGQRSPVGGVAPLAELSQAAQATSHVDQMSTSPPHPPDAMSASPPPNELSSTPLAVIPTYESLQLSKQAAAAPIPKRHPADLVTAGNPDPHPPSPPPLSPGDSFSADAEPRPLLPSSDASFREDSGRSREKAYDESPSRDEEDESGSDNGVTVGHGSEEGAGATTATGMDSPTARMNGRGRRRSDQLVETDEEHHVDAEERREESVPPSSSAERPMTNGDSDVLAPLPLPNGGTPRKSAAGHGRSQSLASPSPSSSSPSRGPTLPPSQGSPRQRPPSSTSSRDPAAREHRSSERRDRERERERSHQADASGSSTREKEQKESSRSRRTLGEWTMSKTLGAGSMGKVKLGVSSVTGEKVAIKIIPRFTSTAAVNRPPPPPPPPAPTPSGTSAAPTDPPATSKKAETGPAPPPTEEELAKAAAKDHSKEVRTLREGSISLLLHHPYVCGMKSMMLYPNHYYMVFEYVNGGQMLDYIISHGRLRERSARKFARQIGSALEYCHANSIVHRDLKIENILISKTGNIKIIDFGLSNLYSPTSHLSTFCGSLYFAAPELLNAKPYTGPEVDVWSFGIVLYVLVCGKVPFDDQSMPALHAKIKRGQVEYPGWLSAECKHLLSRMLVTTPATRATLSEVLNHPWITKGFTGPPAAHLSPRVPLRAEDIDRELIKGMSGFELGSEEEIEKRLMEVLESEGYRRALKNWEVKRAAGISGVEAEEGRESDKERPATRVDGKDMKGLGRSPTNKRFSGLGFYGKKLAGGFNAAFTAGSSGKDDGEGGSGGSSPNGSHSALSSASRVEWLDPTRGFHPLVSLYFLVKEKVEREKIWGPGVFASSTLSLTGPPPPPAPAQAYQAGSGVIPPAPPALAKPSPSAISTSAANAQDVPPPIASPLPVPLTPQPRQRATGEEFPSHHPSTAPQRSRFDSGDYRQDPRKRSSFHPGSSAPTSPAIASHFAQRPQSSYEPASPTPQRIIDRTGSGVGSHSHTHTHTQEQPHVDDVPLSSSPSGFARRFGSLLGRSAPSSSSPAVEPNYKPSHRQRASIGGSVQHKASNKAPASALPQVNETSIRASGSDVPLPRPEEGKAVHRSSTVGELSPNRHQRGVSMGAGPASTVGRAAGSSFGAGGAGSTAAERRRLMNLGAKEEGRPSTAGEQGAVFDEVQEELSDSATRSGAGATVNAHDEPAHQQNVGFIGRTAAASGSGSDQAKPVWLKGLFSVTTTSTKPAATIRADLIRVLDRLGVQHRDVKSGFECAHVPSIDLSSVGANKKDKGALRRRASKLLLSSKDKDTSTAAEESSTSLGGAQGGKDHASSTSFDPMTPNPDSAQAAAGGGGSPPTANNAKFNSSTAEGSTVSSELIVRFEIFIVRMPLLPGISGLQFRRIGGNAWQYQMLARRVLAELKL